MKVKAGNRVYYVLADKDTLRTSSYKSAPRSHTLLLFLTLRFGLGNRKMIKSHLFPLNWSVRLKCFTFVFFNWYIIRHLNVGVLEVRECKGKYCHIVQHSAQNISTGLVSCHI